MLTTRRSFLRTATLSGIGASFLAHDALSWATVRPVRLAFVGQPLVTPFQSPVGWAETLSFTNTDDDAFQRLLHRDDIDALVVDVPPAQRTGLALAAMKAGKCTAFTGPVGQTTGMIQTLMTTHAQTGTPCLLLDNDRFDRNVLAINNLTAQQQFGTLTYVQCGTDSPTNGLGPAMDWLGINRANRFTSLNASIARSWGLHEPVPATPTTKNEPVVKQYQLGEVLTITLQCANGQIVTVNHDLAGKRPHSRGYRVQGNKGLWVEENDLLRLGDRERAFSEVRFQFDHPYWQAKPSDKTIEPSALDELTLVLQTRTIDPIMTQNALTISLVHAVAKASLGAWGEEVELPDWFV